MNKNNTAKTVGLCLLVAFISSLTTYFYFAPLLSDIYIEEGVYPGAPSYTVYQVGGVIYAKNDNGHVEYSGINASYVFNSVTAAMGKNGGLIYVKRGAYNITNSIMVHGGIKIQGEGLNKYMNQSGTKLQLSGGSFPLILMNETVNQYFFSIADIELDGNGNSYYLINNGILQRNCSAGIMLSGLFSDYLIENAFIHGFGVSIYAGNAGWYGRISKCWLEGSGIGLYFEHIQMIVSDSNLSGLTYGIYCASYTNDLLCRNTHIFYCSRAGIFIEKHIGGEYGFNIENCDLTACQYGGLMAYAYPDVYLNVTFNGCNFGSQFGQTPKYCLSVWTTGTSQITIQAVGCRFYPVTNEPLHYLSESTENVTWVLGYNSGNITNTAP
jgi:hypothetical protein